MPSSASNPALFHSVEPISLRRRVTDHVMTGVAVLTVVLVLAPLIAIFGYLVYKGVGSSIGPSSRRLPNPLAKPAGEWPMPLSVPY